MERIQRERGADGPGKCPPKRACKLYVLLERPKRPLSAYNLFFQSERRNLLAVLPERPNGRRPKNSHGKMGFKQMATVIGQRWRDLDGAARIPYIHMANEEKVRHRKALHAYNTQQREIKEQREMSEAIQASLMNGSVPVPSPQGQQQSPPPVQNDHVYDIEPIAIRDFDVSSDSLADHLVAPLTHLFTQMSDLEPNPIEEFGSYGLPSLANRLGPPLTDLVVKMFR